jgi:hypothetical protein
MLSAKQLQERHINLSFNNMVVIIGSETSRRECGPTQCQEWKMKLEHELVE